MAHVKGYRGAQGGWNSRRGVGGYTLNQLNSVLSRRDRPRKERVETEAQAAARLERVRRYKESLAGE